MYSSSAGYAVHGRTQLASATERDLIATSSGEWSSPGGPAAGAEGKKDTVSALTTSTAFAAAGGATINTNAVVVSPPLYISSMMSVRERRCFHQFLVVATAVVSALVLTVVCLWRSTATSSVDSATGKVRLHSFHYFMYCLMGGVAAGMVHLVVTPLDVLKCRMQVGEHQSLRDECGHLFRVEAGGSVRRALPLFFRGWLPTLWGYSLQGAIKFCLYEWLKYALLFSHPAEPPPPPPTPPPSLLLLLPDPLDIAAASTQRPTSGTYQFVVFLFASCVAEMVADVGLAPMEAVKIRMQTSTTFFPLQLRSALPRMWEMEGLHGFYKGLVPLWLRQVPYTMTKFASFEVIVVALRSFCERLGWLNAPLLPGREGEGGGVGGQLLLSLLAGVLAGLLCGLISHPADTVLSKVNQRASLYSVACAPPLLATAIAAARDGSLGSRPCGSLYGVLEVARELGLRGMYKGLAPRLLMVSSLTALQWVTYDGFKVWAGLPTSGGGTRSK